jgi:hypothetical protein
MIVSGVPSMLIFEGHFDDGPFLLFLFLSGDGRRPLAASLHLGKSDSLLDCLGL